jgi:hypothetical protein
MCGSEGTNKKTCPLNHCATNPDYSKHYNVSNISQTGGEDEMRRIQQKLKELGFQISFVPLLSLKNVIEFKYPGTKTFGNLYKVGSKVVCDFYQLHWVYNNWRQTSVKFYNNGVAEICTGDGCKEVSDADAYDFCIDQVEKIAETGKNS